MLKLDYLIKRELSEQLGSFSYRMPLLFENPINLGQSIFQRMVDKHEQIKKFYEIVSKIAQNALDNNDSDIIKILFSEAPTGMTIDYHKKLPLACWDIPIIYRTDESLTGQIYEIQAPGSGWGDLYLFSKCYKHLGYSIPQYLIDFPTHYENNIMKKTGVSNPKVFHMLDAASVPYSMRYLMAITQNLQYWGINENVTMHDIDCLISHSVTSSTTSNYFFDYLKKCENGRLRFAVSPNIIFDEKAIFLLPFYRNTRQSFSDHIRNIFPYTSLIEKGGFYDENDCFVKLEDFNKRPPRDRKYFLKYGGPDTNRNWGSRSVYRLSGNDCEKLLNMADKCSQSGEIWLIQKDIPNYVEEDITIDIRNLLSQKYHLKLSAYYGDDCIMGVKVMARKHFKVHGQLDTYVGIGV